MLKQIWKALSPYVTVTRVTALCTAVLTPPAAILIGKLAVLLAGWGYNIDPTQALVVFLSGVATVIAIVVPIAIKFINARAGFEKALIENNKEHLITAKAITVVAEENKPPALDPSPLSDTHGDDGTVDDIDVSDADRADAPEREQRVEAADDLDPASA